MPAGDIAYVSSDDAGFLIVDISNPMAPSIVSSLSLDSSGDLVVQGTTAYIASTFGVYFVDLVHPEEPSLIGTYPGDCLSLTLDATRLVTADNDLCEVFDLRGEQFVFPIGVNSGFTGGLFVEFPFAYVGDGGFRIIDISNPAFPWTVGLVDLVSGVKAIATVGQHAYLVNGDLRVYDVSNPPTPTFAASIPTPGTATDLVVRDGIGFIADGYSGFRIVDVGAPPAAPTIGSVDTPGFAGSVALSGDLALLADGEFGLRIVDVSNLTAPFEMGFVDTPGNAVDVSVQGSLAAVADATGGVQLIDVSVPSAPSIVQTVPASFTTNAVALTEDVLYFGGNGLPQLTVVDVADPANPISLGSPMPFNSSVNNVIVVDDIVYVAAESGLSLYPVQCGTASVGAGELEVAGMRGIAVFPNPMRNEGTRLVFAAPANAPVKLTIHDVAGRRIRTLAAPAVDSSDEREAFWEGRDDAGALVAPGVYFVRLEATGRAAEVSRITLVR